jgi:hypothetical protein
MPGQRPDRANSSIGGGDCRLVASALRPACACITELLQAENLEKELASWDPACRRVPPAQPEKKDRGALADAPTLDKR